MSHVYILTQHLSTTLKPSISLVLFLELMIRQKSLRVANLAVGNPSWINPISNCAKQILLNPLRLRGWSSVSGVTEASIVRVVLLFTAQPATKCHTLEDSKPQHPRSNRLHHWDSPCPAKTSCLTTYALFLAQRWHSVFRCKLCTKDWYREEL